MESESCASRSHSAIGSSVRDSHSTVQTFDRLESLYKCYTDSQHGLHKSEVWSFLDFCACIIQRWWRYLHSNSVQSSLILSSKSHITTKSDGSPPPGITPQQSIQPGAQLSEYEAAIKMQQAWRRYVNKQVYRYYRNLLDFKCRGDPAEFLRCINPREAALVDPAAGTHVRFRLGGENFPPSIYYKIFTSGSVVDIGNFAPRYYTEATCKKMPSRYVHNKGEIGQNDEPTLWYNREENNDWRLVSGQDLYKLTFGVTQPEPEKKKKFVLVSKADQMRRMRRKKRIHWLKLFHQKETLGKEKADVDEVIISAAKGMSEVAARKGIDAVEDWEIDELLEWTNGLNFDDYLRSWSESATSMNCRDLRGTVMADTSYSR